MSKLSSYIELKKGLGADKVFMDAVETVARYYVAGIDSAVRHSRKGDARDYRDKANRSASWHRGYSFALNVLEKYGVGNLRGYSKEALGSTCHDAECALLSMLGFVGGEYEAKQARTRPEPPKSAQAARDDAPTCETSACLWYDHEVEGAKKAAKGKHAGMWYVKKVA